MPSQPAGDVDSPAAAAPAEQACCHAASPDRSAISRHGDGKPSSGSHQLSAAAAATMAPDDPRQLGVHQFADGWCQQPQGMHHAWQQMSSEDLNTGLDFTRALPSSCSMQTISINAVIGAATLIADHMNARGHGAELWPCLSAAMPTAAIPCGSPPVEAITPWPAMQPGRHEPLAAAGCAPHHPPAGGSSAAGLSTSDQSRSAADRPAADGTGSG